MSKRRRDARRNARKKQRGAGGMPDMGGMSNKQMQKALSQMDTEEINDVIEVVVRTKTEDIVLKNPEVSIMNMGQEIWSVVPESVVRQKPGTAISAQPLVEDDEEEIEIEIKDADLKLIMSTANVDEETATNALRKAKGDLAAAMMSLS